MRQTNANCVLFIITSRKILTKTIETCKHTEIYLNFFMVTVRFFVFAATSTITTPGNLIQAGAADLQCSTSCQEELQCQTPTHPTQLQATVDLSSHSPVSTIVGHLGCEKLYLILLKREHFQHQKQISLVNFLFMTSTYDYVNLAQFAFLLSDLKIIKSDLSYL